MKKQDRKLFFVLLIAVLLLSFVPVPAGSAQMGEGFIRHIQTLEGDQTGLTNPTGLFYLSTGKNIHVIEGGTESSFHTDIIKLSVFAEHAGSTRIFAFLKNPINVTFDTKANRLLMLQTQSSQLLEIPADNAGGLLSGKMIRHDAKRFGIQNPQGMAVDSKNGMIFILDATGPRIFKLELKADGNIDSSKSSTINLSSLKFSFLRGIAVDPKTGHLFVIDTPQHKLYELTQNGQLVAVRDLAGFNLKSPQGIVFAPSGDQTDDPSQMSLFVADSGFVVGGIKQPLLKGSKSFQTQSITSNGQIVELSMEVPIEIAAVNFTSTLIKTTNMAALTPPSPDPSGITYLPNSNTLLVVDGEVDETVSGVTHFQGANVWELTLTGSKVRTTNISKVAPTATPMTNEPTGVSWNPTNGHYYVTDDDARRVYDLNPGGDGLMGTSDDTWTFFDTLGAGSGDPEGVAYDTWRNRIFVADGVNAEVYEFTIAGTLVNHFDVQVHGITDPESIEFNPDSGTLFVLGNTSTPYVIETTLDGALLQTIDVSAHQAGAPAGLAYASASNGSGAKRFYIVDRAVDNNSNPNIVDGKLFEMTAPASASATVTPSNTPTKTATPTVTNTPDPNGTATFTPSPTFTATATSTSTPTFTPTPAPSSNPLYVTFSNSGTIGGVSFADEDILRFDGVTWSMLFDGSDVGVGSPDLAAFSIVDPDTILMSFSSSVSVGGLAIAPMDVVQFDATSLGSVTAGAFSMYLNGVDVGLDSNSENIDAISLLPNGHVLISTTGTPTVSGLAGLADEDILEFTPTTLGGTTSGIWSVYFDGSDVGLAESSNEDIDALGIGPNGAIYLSTLGDFSVPGVSGFDEDAFVCYPTSVGNITACSYSPVLYFDGSTWAQGANDVDGLELLILGPILTSTPSFTPTPTFTSTSTFTPTATFLATFTPTITSSATLGPSPTPTNTPTATVTFTPSSTPLPSATPTATYTATVTNVPGSPLIVIPDADAYVVESSPAGKNGTKTTLWVEGGSDPDFESYVRFTVSGITGTVQSAVLRVYATSDTVDGPAVFSAENNWTESTITWNTKPLRIGNALDDKGGILPNTWIEYDVTVVVTGDGVYSFVLTTDSIDSVSFSSREGTQPPQLVLNIGP